MAEVASERQLGETPDQVWAVLRDFGNVAWIPGAGRVDVDGDGPGMRRHIYGSGTEPVVERLLSRDDDARTLTYTIDENNPLPVASYTGSVRVSDAPGGSTLRWSAEFEPAGDEAEATAVIEVMLATLIGWVADEVAAGG